MQLSETISVPLAEPIASPADQTGKVRTDGRFFRLGEQKWYVKGFTYGPFPPDSGGEFFPAPGRAAADLELISGLEANCVRVYHIPPVWLLDEAIRHDIRVFIDVPWDKHRCFFEDWPARREARQRIRDAARLLGAHPATFAISVANEIPKDIVRYSGHRRVAKFLDELIDVVKQECPECLATYANYPSTEFLQPEHADFVCFNVFLEDADQLSSYLDRLQHLAGAKPLILSEFGIDSHRHGEDRQSDLLCEHVRHVFRKGLAGSFVFSFTDEWFTGGAQVEDWAFGVMTSDRRLKPAAEALSDSWKSSPGLIGEDLPPVSVAVCTYNGADTLAECLTSLTKLNYPDYEVIVVDDGSTDKTAQIADQFPSVRCIHQDNRGLSIARNVAAQAATGQIIAYTDCDCAADEDWLLHLVRAMQDQQADAIGGPNLPPPVDGSVAQCISASPGSPSHVMLDDSTAEHVPGCNMAFRLDKLLAIGGFDARFRAAGDDVDVCWRFLDAGLKIGFAPAAIVWHHRRGSVAAYIRQQRGYGRAEAMLQAKHPHRFTELGRARWNGIIYGETPEASRPVCIHHGQFGTGLFQFIYRNNNPGPWSYPLLLGWHLLALFILSMAPLLPGLGVVAGLMWCLSITAAVRAARAAKLPRNSPWWSRAMVTMLHLLQPVVRAGERWMRRLHRSSLPRMDMDDPMPKSWVRRMGRRRWDVYWTSNENRGREDLLATLQREAARAGFNANFESQWSSWDVLISGDAWHDVAIHTATEELGQAKRFTRARCELRPTPMLRIAMGAAMNWAIIAAVSGHWWAATGAAIIVHILAAAALVAARHTRIPVARLLWHCGKLAGL